MHTLVLYSVASTTELYVHEVTVSNGGNHVSTTHDKSKALTFDEKTDADKLAVFINAIRNSEGYWVVT